MVPRMRNSGSRALLAFDKPFAHATRFIVVFAVVNCSMEISVRRSSHTIGRNNADLCKENDER